MIAACRDATWSDTIRPEDAVLARRRVPSNELTVENSAWLRRFEADTGSDCYTRRFRDADTLGSSDNLNLPSCPSQMVVTPNAGDGTYSLWHSPDAMDGNGSADSLVVTFSRPVGMLTILRDGTHSCYDTTIGQVVAYGADGAELGRSPFDLIQTCSDALPTLREERAADSRVGAKAATDAPYTSPYAEYAEAILPISAGVTRLVFLPPEVWDFTYANPYFPGDVRQYNRQGTYSLIFRPDAQAAAHVKITVDSATLTQGDTTVFRVTAPGATQWAVTGFQFVPVLTGSSGAVMAVRETMARHAPGVTSNRSAGSPSPRPVVRQVSSGVGMEGARRAPAGRLAHFLDAAFECGEAMVTVCYDDPVETGYQIVTAVVDGDLQRDSVLVTVMPATPALRISCPTSVSRGDQVACTIGLTNPTLPFDITEINVNAISAMSAFAIAIQPPGPMAAGAVYSLIGPGVASSTLTVRGRAEWQGNPVALTKTAGFAVLQRPVERDDYIMTLRPAMDGPGRTSKYPGLGGGTLGLYRSQPPDFNDLTVATASAGPNQGLSYVLSIPGIPASLINLTFALFPGDPWYKAHPDESGPLNDFALPICTKNQIDRLRLQVERHEGTTMARNSHYGIDQDLLRRWKLGTFMGSLVLSPQGSAEQIRYQFGLEFAAEWSRERAALKPLDDAFDDTDIPASYSALGCSIFLKS